MRKLIVVGALLAALVVPGTVQAGKWTRTACLQVLTAPEAVRAQLPQQCKHYFNGHGRDWR